MDGDGCVSRVSGVVRLVWGYMSGGGGSMGCRGRKVGRGGERGGAQRTERAKPFSFSLPPPVSGARRGDKARNTRREASAWTVGSATGCRGWWAHAPGFNAASESEGRAGCCGGSGVSRGRCALPVGRLTPVLSKRWSSRRDSVLKIGEHE